MDVVLVMTGCGVGEVHPACWSARLEGAGREGEDAHAVKEAGACVSIESMAGGWAGGLLSAAWG